LLTFTVFLRNGLGSEVFSSRSFTLPPEPSMNHLALFAMVSLIVIASAVFAFEAYQREARASHRIDMIQPAQVLAPVLR
jgi:hypothetical protein